MRLARRPDRVIDLARRQAGLDRERAREVVAKPRMEIGLARRVRPPYSQAERRFDEGAEIPCRDMGADARQSGRQLRDLSGNRRGKDCKLRLRHELAGFLILQHREARRHIGLESESLKQARAKSVDGVDAQAARRLDGAREKAPRLADPFSRRSLARDFLDRLAERRVIEADPARKLSEDAVRHLGRRRLGEGET